MGWPHPEGEEGTWGGRKHGPPRTCRPHGARPAPRASAASLNNPQAPLLYLAVQRHAGSWLLGRGSARRPSQSATEAPSILASSSSHTVTPRKQGEQRKNKLTWFASQIQAFGFESWANKFFFFLKEDSYQNSLSSSLCFPRLGQALSALEKSGCGFPEKRPISKRVLNHLNLVKSSLFERGFETESFNKLRETLFVYKSTEDKYTPFDLACPNG